GAGWCAADCCKSRLQRAGAGPALGADVELDAVGAEVLHLEVVARLGRAGQALGARRGELVAGRFEVLDKKAEVVEAGRDLAPRRLRIREQHRDIDVAVRQIDATARPTYFLETEDL